jgi:hypothetical protein
VQKHLKWKYIDFAMFGYLNTMDPAGQVRFSQWALQDKNPYLGI